MLADPFDDNVLSGYNTNAVKHLEILIAAHVDSGV